MDWDELDSGWQTAFENAWSAYRENTIPIGAAIQNEQGEIAAAAHNGIFSAADSEMLRGSNQIVHHKLAHAEINAILQLNEDEHPGIRHYVLTTMMEPCPLCFGAIVMGSIRHVRFAARDSYAGATFYAKFHEYIKNKNIRIEGPFENLEEIQIAVQTCFELEHNPTHCAPALWAWEKDCPYGVITGRSLFRDKVLHQLKQNGAETPEVFNRIAGMVR